MSQQISTSRQPLDTATITLGVLALACLTFIALEGSVFRFVQVRSWAIAVLAVLGVLAVLAGVLRRPALTIAAGALFLLATVLQVVLISIRTNWLGGSISTSSLWLGLGIGLLAVGLAGLDRAGDAGRSESGSIPN